MQIKNLSNHDISFQFKSPRSTSQMPVYDTVNVIAGWTVQIEDDVFNVIKNLTRSVAIVEEVEIEIEGVTMRNANNQMYTPTRKERMCVGFNTVNVLDEMVSEGVVRLIQSNEKPAMPSRDVMTSFLKRFNEKVTDKMTDEEVFAKVEEVKAELKALSF